MSNEITQLEVTMVACEVLANMERGAVEFAPDKTGGREVWVRVKLEIGSYHRSSDIVPIEIYDPVEARAMLARWMAYCEGERPRPTFSLDIARMLIAN